MTSCPGDMFHEQPLLFFTTATVGAIGGCRGSALGVVEDETGVSGTR